VRAGKQRKEERRGETKAGRNEDLTLNQDL